MIRDSMGGSAYWDKWVSHSLSRTKKMVSALAQPSMNPLYDPQYSFDAAFEFLRLILERYSRGDPIDQLVPHFSGIVEMWELSNNLSKNSNGNSELRNLRDWTFELRNLNHYNFCFWLVGLAIILDISSDHWNRLLILIGAEGQDNLLDRVISYRQPGRAIGSDLLHHKPYARLLKAVNAADDIKSSLLFDFVENWYPELARKGNDELWWYVYGDPAKHPIESGSYFGRWCIEAAVVAKVFKINDTPCLAHQYYPGDLLRVDSVNVYRIDSKKSGFIKNLFVRKK